MAEISLQPEERPPAPILVSVGKIIGYKLAGLEVVMKTMDFFNERLFSKSTSTTKDSHQNFPVPDDNNRRNTNINAKQESTTNLDSSSNNKPSVGRKRRTSRGKKTKILDKKRAERKGILKSKSTTTVLRAKTRQNQDTKRTEEQCNNRSMTESSRKRLNSSVSEPALDNFLFCSKSCSTVKTSPTAVKFQKQRKSDAVHKCDEDEESKIGAKKQSISKIPQTMFYVIFNDKTKKLEDASHRRTRSMPGEKESSKVGKVSRSDSLGKPSDKSSLGKHSDKSSLGKPSDKSSLGKPSDKSSSPNLGRASDMSAVLTSNKKYTGKRRWADIVTGTSIKETGVALRQEPDAQPESEKLINVPSGENTSASGKCPKRNVKPVVITGSDESKRLGEFPSLKDQEGRRLKKEKYYSHASDKNQVVSKTCAKKTPTTQHPENIYPILSSARGKSKRNCKKRGKMVAKVKRNTEEDTTQMFRAVSTAASPPLSTCSWTIDDMWEVITQPPGAGVPLHEISLRTDTQKSQKGQGANFDKRAVCQKNTNSSSTRRSPQNGNQTSNSDICSRLRSISVGEDARKKSSCKGKRKKTADTASKVFGGKGSRSQTRSTVDKIKRPEPIVQPKKISARYRALLRRDNDKSDAKTLTPASSSNKWIDNRPYGLVDRIQNPTDSLDQNDPAEGTSQQTAQLHPAVIFLPPQNNIICPTM